MVDPITASFAIGSAIQGIGNLFGGDSQSDALNRNAEIARQNAQANSQDILALGQFNAGVTEALAGANAAGVRTVAEFNANAIRQTAGYNAEQIRRTSEYEAGVQEYNANIAGQNADIASRNAALARELAEFDAEQIRRENRRTQGAQIAGFAKAGVVLDGSAYDVIYDSAIEGFREELIARYAGDITAYQFFVQATDAMNQEQFLNYNAEAIRTQGEIESTYALWKGDLDAQATLLQGYTNAGLIMAEGQLRSALTLYQADLGSAAALREGDAAASTLRSSASAVQGSSLFNASASFLTAGAPFFPSFGGPTTFYSEGTAFTAADLRS